MSLFLNNLCHATHLWNKLSGPLLFPSLGSHQLKVMSFYLLYLNHCLIGYIRFCKVNLKVFFFPSSRVFWQMKKYLLSRSPNPCSYLFQVWSKSTEPSTLRWMTVEPSSVEFVTNIFQVKSLLYKSNKRLHKDHIANSSFGLVLWPVIVRPYWFLFRTYWPIVQALWIQKESFLMLSLN